MSKNNVKPEIRFKNFTDAWEQRKFTEIVDRVKTSSNSNLLPRVEFEDIKASEGRLNKDVSRKFDTRKGILFKPNNILFGKLRPYLKNWLLPDFEGIALGDFWVFKPKNSDAYFIYYLIQTSKYQKVANDTSGTKMPRSDWKLVSTTSFSIPCFEEQMKIGSFLQRLDNTIALHQYELTLLKQRKKALFQKMFPKKGEITPTLRFDGFTDAWEEVKLGDGCDISTGKLNANAMVVNGSYPFFTCSKDIYLTNTYSFDDEALIIAGNGDMGAVKYYNGRFDAYQRTYVLTNVKWDVKYLEYCLSVNLPRRIHLMTYGSTMPYITKPTLTDMHIHVPSFEEQQKIGAFFAHLDEQITQLEDKVEQYKTLKKAFLQKMFV